MKLLNKINFIEEVGGIICPLFLINFNFAIGPPCAFFTARCFRLLALKAPMKGHNFTASSKINPVIKLIIRELITTPLPHTK